MAERNALMPGRGARESNALAPDTLADGSPNPDATAGYRQAYDWRQAQIAQSVAEGYLDPVTGLPTAKFFQGAGNEYANALLMGSTAPGVRAFHGSPHSFERFDLGKIGTGEGAQAYGHGLYFAEQEGVARNYKTQLSGDPTVNGRPLDWANPSEHAAAIVYDEGSKAAAIQRLSKEVEYLRGTKGYDEATDPAAGALRHLQADAALPALSNPGSMYEVNIGSDPEHFLHWDKPLSEQSPHVQEALMSLAREHAVKSGDNLARLPVTKAMSEGNLSDITGGEAYHGAGGFKFPAETSQALRDAGIPGIRYLDQVSRGAGEGSHNLVVFNPENIEILRKYGLAGLGLGGAAAAGAAQQSDGAQ